MDSGPRGRKGGQDMRKEPEPSAWPEVCPSVHPRVKTPKIQSSLRLGQT